MDDDHHRPARHDAQHRPTGDNMNPSPRSARTREAPEATETLVCAFRPWSVPRAFPVIHRPTPATRRLTVVAREADRVLVCDDAHAGPHMWPTGEMVAVAADGLTDSGDVSPLQTGETTPTA